MAWVFLFLAGLFEVVWAISLKYTQGFTRLYPTIITVAGMAISFYLLSVALRTLPIGTAYAVWTGIGALGTVIVGMLFLGESRDVMRIVFLLLLVTGIVGLKVTASH
ncbi:MULTISPECIES: quaternary ammonium compound efflux SMR transporter SugE [Aneurinibacillus]|jgi:quaternary ammonium compound-resistance protein SugE|uniref:Multidrug transporter n=1 Tax=Aneurinibacillus danicus TaxID=267746 RepID=A0A511V4Z1_9BACL|nr:MULTISPECIES: quaternary ammonium compound efflux SMR transporter SugE [Aneurinibacillus]GEN33990.1 multidrug transporter [Aneurinibacillus danicus]